MSVEEGDDVEQFPVTVSHLLCSFTAKQLVRMGGCPSPRHGSYRWLWWGLELEVGGWGEVCFQGHAGRSCRVTWL